MTDQTDFIVLYHELGIEPDCSMDGLRLAYRRRVADLHPDRGGAADEDELKSLNRRYAAALEFHRHYGRLPGAAPAPRVRRRSAQVDPSRAVEVAGPAEPELEPEVRRPSRVVVYGIVLVTAVLVWWLPRTDASLPGFLESVVNNKRGNAPPTAMGLRQGMGAREVVSLLGDPVSREFGGSHWQYGPSWVRFECDEVVDWYSSPLRPLKASRSRPAGAPSAGTGARRCAKGASAAAGRW